MCLDDAQLLRLLRNDATEPQLSGWREHAQQCANCARRLAELRSTWDELGQWTIEPPNVDLSAQVMAAARRDQTRSPLRWARVAAAVLLMVAGGWWAGRLMPVQPSPAPAPVSDEQLVAVSGLDDLAQDVDLLSPIFDWTEPSDSTPEEQI